ncbi:MAG: hypothetical protein NC311_07670 [Muribaculaceae bacterium]|nr:hypothetical protein [Muribaculaceae bacterium]
MRTILFTTEKQANEYAEYNHLQATGATTETSDTHSELEYYDEDEFFAVVGSWTGEVSAEVYTDGEEEIALAWWFNDGDAPTVNVDGEEITAEDIIDGVYATNADPAEIDAEAAQYILIDAKRNGVEILTPEDEGEFEDAAAKLDFTGNMPSRIFKSENCLFALLKDY